MTKVYQFSQEDYDSLPKHCPRYLSIAFDIHREEGLPMGVYEVEGIYYCVIYHGSYNAPRFEQPFDCPLWAHKHWQAYWLQSMRQALQYYSFSELYNEAFAKALRLLIEAVEDDHLNNRETVF